MIHCSPVEPLAMSVAVTTAAMKMNDPQSSFLWYPSSLPKRKAPFHQIRLGPKRPSLMKLYLVLVATDYLPSVQAPF
jgi:hypothetical protein